MSGPIFYTPLTGVSNHWLTHQWTKCAGIELDYYRCAARVGAVKGPKVCKKEFEDLNECVNETKQTDRYILIQAERRKQKKKFMEQPPRDSYGVM